MWYTKCMRNMTTNGGAARMSGCYQTNSISGGLDGFVSFVDV